MANPVTTVLMIIWASSDLAPLMVGLALVSMLAVVGGSVHTSMEQIVESTFKTDFVALSSVGDVVVQVGADFVDPTLLDRSGQLARVEPHPPCHQL